MRFLSRLFGSQAGGAAEPETPVVHKDFRIFPDPIREGSTYRVAARIELDVDGAVKEHQMIRADTVNDLDEAKATSIRKAKQMIDEQGGALFR